ncbi:MAG: hypothetical protein ABSC31_14025 [Acidimicrobiales bacterium]
MFLRGSGPLLWAPKTQASYRIVPLPAVVLNALAAHVARYPGGTDGEAGRSRCSIARAS